MLDFLKETRILEYKPTDTPIDPNIKLRSKIGSNPNEKERYQRLVGKLINLSHTIPNIS